MTFSTAYLLVFHGSRDSYPQIAAAQLARLVQQQMVQKKSSNYLPKASLQLPECPLVAVASLELTPTPLCETIYQFALEAEKSGVDLLQILPLFLLPGVHVTEDIPHQVQIAEQLLAGRVKIDILSYFGSNPGVIDLLAKEFSQLPAQARILIAHGSRKTKANEPIESLAAQLGAFSAYWSISPSLSEQINALVNSSISSIAIVPYFLFAGGITKSIAQEIRQLQSIFPSVKLLFGKPLAPTVELASLIVERI